MIIRGFLITTISLVVASTGCAVTGDPEFLGDIIQRYHNYLSFADINEVLILMPNGMGIPEYSDDAKSSYSMIDAHP